MLTWGRAGRRETKVSHVPGIVQVGSAGEGGRVGKILVCVNQLLSSRRASKVELHRTELWDQVRLMQTLNAGCTDGSGCHTALLLQAFLEVQDQASVVAGVGGLEESN